MTEPLRFREKREAESDSWRRARPTRALIEQLEWDTWLVTLPGGSVHEVELWREHGAYLGTCDCRGYEHGHRPCAHLCTVRKAEFGDVEDVRGRAVEVVDPEERRAQRVDRLPTAADGGEPR